MKKYPVFLRVNMIQEVKTFLMEDKDYFIL